METHVTFFILRVRRFSRGITLSIAQMTCNRRNPWSGVASRSKGIEGVNRCRHYFKDLWMPKVKDVNGSERTSSYHGRYSLTENVIKSQVRWTVLLDRTYFVLCTDIYTRWLYVAICPSWRTNRSKSSGGKTGLLLRVLGMTVTGIK